MLVCRCPRCGAACPVSIATPEAITCQSCTYAGPPAAAVTEALGGARSAIEELSIQSLQLDETQRRFVLLARAFRASVILVSALIFGPMALFPCCLVGAGFMVETPDRIWAFMMAIPTAAFVISGLVMMTWAGRRHRRLEEACLAVPPSSPGADACCRVCGAPIRAPAGGESPIARCGFCRADNLLDARAFGRLSRERLEVVSNYRQEVLRRGRSLDGATALSMAIVMGVPFAVLFGVGALVGLVGGLFL